MIYCVLCIISVVIGYILSLTPKLFEIKRIHRENFIQISEDEKNMMRESEKAIKQLNNMINFTGVPQEGDKYEI